MESHSPQEIFDHISDLIAQEDFIEAQETFMEANCKAFEDDEENKHEYKQIYEEYLLIIDRLIEAKLKEEHGISDEDIKQFYTTF